MKFDRFRTSGPRMRNVWFVAKLSPLNALKLLKTQHTAIKKRNKVILAWTKVLNESILTRLFSYFYLKFHLKPFNDFWSFKLERNF